MFGLLNFIYPPALSLVLLNLLFLLVLRKTEDVVFLLVLRKTEAHTGKYLVGHLLSKSPTMLLREREPNSKRHVSVHNDGLEAVVMTKLQLLFIATSKHWHPHLKYQPHSRVEMRYFNVSSSVQACVRIYEVIDDG